MFDLKGLLLQFDANVLKQIAREHGIENKNQTKNQMVDLLVRKLVERGQVEHSLGRLNRVEREVLNELLRAGGEVAVGALDPILARQQLVTTPRRAENPWEHKPRVGDPNYGGKPALEDVAARLLLLGLVFSREVDDPNSYRQVMAWDMGHFLVIPKEIRPYLPRVADEPLPKASDPPRVESGSARNFQRDLSRYAGFVRREGKLDLTTQGWVYKKTLVEIAKALGRTDAKKVDEKNDLYLSFLRRMLTSLELIRPEGIDRMVSSNVSVLFPSDKAEFWSRPPAERVKTAFEAYLDSADWNELRIPKATYGIDHRRAAPNELKQARRTVIERIKRNKATGWINLADLIDDIRLSAYEFLFPRSMRSTHSYNYGVPATPYYYSNNPYGISYERVQNEAEGWNQVEAAIIQHMVTGPLHWLGLTDVGFDQNSATPRAYRLTPMGAWLLGVGAPVTISEEGGRVVVQPNFQIVAMEPIAENVLMSLDEFSDFEGGDHAMTYRLTRESVYRGQRAGWSAARIIQYLEEAAHAPLSQNIRRSLEEWQALHERITFRRAVPLLQAENGATLDELWANAALAPQLGHRVGEQIALPAEKADSLADSLRHAGWLPVVTHRDQTDAPESMVADPEGNVEFVHRTPSIYAYGGIEPFAQRLDERHARLTRESIGAAVERKISVPTMLSQLKQVHRGPLPAELITRLKAWGKYYGDAQMGTMTLIEFRDEQARAELLSDPRLKPYLTRFDAGQRPLALVRSDSVERVKELLAERGVEIRNFNS